MSTVYFSRFLGIEHVIIFLFDRVMYLEGGRAVLFVSQSLGIEHVATSLFDGVMDLTYYPTLMAVGDARLFMIVGMWITLLLLLL